MSTVAECTQKLAEAQALVTKFSETVRTSEALYLETQADEAFAALDRAERLLKRARLDTTAAEAALATAQQAERAARVRADLERLAKVRAERPGFTSPAVEDAIASYILACEKLAQAVAENEARRNTLGREIIELCKSTGHVPDADEMPEAPFATFDAGITFGVARGIINALGYRSDGAHGLPLGWLERHDIFAVGQAAPVGADRANAILNRVRPKPSLRAVG